MILVEDGVIVTKDITTMVDKIKIVLNVITDV
jgi:hypothetical protein